MKTLVYIVLVMVSYDWLIHIAEFKGWHWKFIESRSVFSYVYPHLRWKKNPIKPDEPTERKKFRVYYDWFWAIYWGVAIILLGSYLYLTS